MNCDESRALIDGYADGELDLVRSLEVERHIGECTGCSSELSALQTLRTSMKSPDMRFPAPEALVSRIRKEAQKNSTRGQSLGWRQLAYVAALLVVFAASVVILRTTMRRDNVAEQVVASHVRSLMASHLYDVQSTDQHTVKPWFHGRLDYAPPVVDLADKGYPLVGGRLDVLEGHPVAAIVYQRRQHPINVFVWPTKGTRNSRARNVSMSGYNLIHWQSAGMEYWVISDLNDNELRAFAQMLQSE